MTKILILYSEYTFTKYITLIAEYCGLEVVKFDCTPNAQKYLQELSEPNQAPCAYFIEPLTYEAIYDIHRHATPTTPLSLYLQAQEKGCDITRF